MALSLIGIGIGLVLLVILCYKGCNVLWAAPVCAAVVALCGGLNLLDAYLNDFMTGAADYVMQWFPPFLLGAIYGKLMDSTGAARSLGDKLVSWIGPKAAVAAVVIPCLLMTYGGISLFVVVFVIYPMGYAIYRAADIPRKYLPGAIAFGAFGISMTCIPGSPQIQNIIPTTYYGTTAAAAPLLSIIGVIVIGVPGYIFLEMQVRKAKKRGEHFVADPKHIELQVAERPSWHWLTGIIPLAVVVFMLNIFPNILVKLGGPELTTSQGFVISLLCGIIVCMLLNIKYRSTFFAAVNDGAVGSMGAILSTSSAVGFGSVVKAVPGFAVLTSIALNMPGSILFSEAIAVNLMAGATGSASGGLSIALTALADGYLAKAAEIGLDPGVLHRIASMASGGLDSLPQNGAVLTLLATANCTHKEAYKGIMVTTVIIPVVGSILIAFVAGLFI